MDGRYQSVRDPRFQPRHVNAKRTFHPRADEIARAEFAITQHAFDLRLWLLATWTLMRGQWRGDLLTRHDRPPAEWHQTPSASPRLGHLTQRVRWMEVVSQSGVTDHRTAQLPHAQWPVTDVRRAGPSERRAAAPTCRPVTAARSCLISVGAAIIGSPSGYSPTPSVRAVSNTA
jgi:hypothetical protein